jgi:thiamine biosynthesis lipoprotein
MPEARDTFDCFGGQCTVLVDSPVASDARDAVARARRRLLEWHHQFSRFEPGSELSLLNADERETVPVTPMMRRVIEAALAAAERTGGLVDPTLLTELERAGYATHFEGMAVPAARALDGAHERRPARPHPQQRWRAIATDRRAGTVTRTPGIRLDPGGIAKGLFADELSAQLAGATAFAIDCAGDIRVGRTPRQVQVESPLDGTIVHTMTLAEAGVATSGIARRSWVDSSTGLPAHHLLDPATGRPAFTGIVQATAVASTAAEAEALSKAALLSGPDEARRWLPHGGVLVLDDGTRQLVEAGA